jgi:hypothetical protein
MPRELRRIIESDCIAKVGTGFLSDGLILFIDCGCNARLFRDVGFMIRLIWPEEYAERGGPLSLEDCVKDLFQKKLDKEETHSNWAQEFEEDSQEINCELLLYFVCALI